MASVENLKKQLRGIRSTQKLTKAMKTISSVKFSKLSELYSGYSDYGKQCRKILNIFGPELLSASAPVNEESPVAVIVIASNKGLCGSYNAEILSLAQKTLKKHDNAYLITVGKKAAAYFKNKARTPKKEFVFGDIPTFADSALLAEEIIKLRREGAVSRAFVVYAEYSNMLKQTPVEYELFSFSADYKEDNSIFVPNRETVAQKAADDIFAALLYEILLSSSVGAQAATLMTMRSAYDTATEYCNELEKQINRMRQSAVTADVLETFSERDER